MPYIYKITNQINGKIYIGKTLHSIEKRWKEHCKDSQRFYNEKRPLYSAMNKYGIENFLIEQVEECNEEQLNDREKYWIEYYGSFKYGYNATKGGDGKQYVDYDLIYSLFNEGKTNREIHNITGYDCSTITLALEINGVSKEKRIERGNEVKRKSVAMLNLQTLEIEKVFSSISEAALYLSKPKSTSHISQVCLGKRKSAYGYNWKYI